MRTPKPQPPRSTINQNVSHVVKILLVGFGMEQTELARLIHMDKATLSRTLGGHRKWTLEDIERMAAVFERPMGYFFEPADTLIRSRCFRRATDRYDLGTNVLQLDDVA